VYALKFAFYVKYRLLANTIFDEYLTRHSDAYGKPIGSGSLLLIQKKGIVLWLQALPAADTGKAWFADAELYINPT
jgi:hypothetical protein